MICKYVDKTEEDLHKQLYVDKDLIIKDVRLKKMSFLLERILEGLSGRDWPSEKTT